MWSWWSHNLATAGFFSRKDEGLSAGVSACWRRGWCILYGNTLFDAQTMNCISGRKKKPGCLLQTSGLLSPIPTSTSVPDGVQDVVSGTSTPSLQILISRWCSACRSSAPPPLSPPCTPPQITYYPACSVPLLPLLVHTLPSAWEAAAL